MNELRASFSVGGVFLLAALFGAAPPCTHRRTLAGDPPPGKALVFVFSQRPCAGSRQVPVLVNLVRIGDLTNDTFAVATVIPEGLSCASAIRRWPCSRSRRGQPELFRAGRGCLQRAAGANGSASGGTKSTVAARSRRVASSAPRRRRSPLRRAPSRRWPGRPTARCAPADKRCAARAANRPPARSTGDGPVHRVSSEWESALIVSGGTFKNGQRQQYGRKPSSVFDKTSSPVLSVETEWRNKAASPSAASSSTTRTTW